MRVKNGEETEEMVNGEWKMENGEWVSALVRGSHQVKPGLVEGTLEKDCLVNSLSAEVPHSATKAED